MINLHPRQILLIQIVALALCVALFTACDPKNEPRWRHEQPVEWKPVKTPDQPHVHAATFTQTDSAVEGYYAKVKAGDKDLSASVLKPLSRIVLNRRFIESPMYRGAALSKMINVFNAAFVVEYAKQPQSPEFARIKQNYYNTVFSGCNTDLRTNCTNAQLFAADGRHTMIMTLLARELDGELESLLKEAGSPDLCVKNSARCRTLIEERYRRLAMGVYKSNRYQDNEFAFAYLKYARVFSAFLQHMTKEAPKKDDPRNMSSSYLAGVHGKIFETVIAKFKPGNLDDPEFRAFVDNFNPWGYSRKKADTFQYGTGVMFSLASQCCLYSDPARTQLAKNVSVAIEESQKDTDNFGLSFRQMIDDIKKEHNDRVFAKLGMGTILAQIENPKSGFYDEYFFIVDRLFRGHLNTGEIEMMLRNTNPARAKVELPKRISTYIKVNLIYMIVETNRFMAKIYRSGIASDRIFEEAIRSSRDLTGRWLERQARIDMLDKLMNSYFKERLVTSPEYSDAYDLIRAVNRNIHYTAVVPQMIVMNYFLTNMKGKFKVETWWNETFEIEPETILKAFFDGVGWTATAWFRYNRDTETVDRLNILYGLEYLLSTESLNYFTAKDNADSNDKSSERSKFFDLIFTRYLGDSVDGLRKDVNSYIVKTVTHSSYNFLNRVCTYETGGNVAPPEITIEFNNLENYTYTGLGDNGLNSVLRDFLRLAASPAKEILTNVSRRRTYMQTMMNVIEGDLLRTKQIAKAGDPHPDLNKAREVLKNLDQIQTDLTNVFVGNHKRLFDCALRLREIERRRAYRLYDEERKHLGRIFDLMKPLASIKNEQELKSKIDEINKTQFADGADYRRLDRLDGMTYRMTKFDLHMRMKTRIESDIFYRAESDATDDFLKKELAAYGPTFNELNKPRNVRVNVPRGIYREDIFASGPNRPVKFLGTTDAHREDFIRQGMDMLTGEPNTFVRWVAQAEGDTSQFDYLEALTNFYLLQKPESVELPDVTPTDLVDAYIRVVSALSLDPLDLENLEAFQKGGRYSKDLLQKVLFEKDGMTRLPFFYTLMNDVMTAASIHLEQKGAVGTEVLDFAKRLNSLQAFVFPPSGTVRETVQTLYGDRMHYRLNRVSALFTEVKNRTDAVSDATKLDPRIAFPYFRENSGLLVWYQPEKKNLLDTQKMVDLRFLINDFTQRSGKVYGTQEKVAAP